MASIISGKVTCYNLNNESIHYRGKIIPLYSFVNKPQFMILDIYWGINKNIGVMCRIMPVINNNKVKWIGIYNKQAKIN